MSGAPIHLSAIARRDPGLAQRLRQVAPSPLMRVFTARSGAPTAEALNTDGTHPPRLLHSRFDPRREAERMVDATEPRGFVICLGLGLGYHVARVLEHDAVAMVLVVDFHVSMVRALLEHWPHEGLFDDPRLHLVVDQEPDALAQTIGSRYVPIVHGDVSTVSLRGRVEGDPDTFSFAVRTVQGAVDLSIGNFSVQQLFGRRWMRNIVINLVDSVRPAPLLPHLDRAVVTGAGPSLDDELASPAPRKRADPIVATDSSLSALTAAGIRPALTVAVDAQQISYLHAMGAPAYLGTLVADLGVAPTVARRFAEVYWIAGDHPLVALLRSRGIPIARLETGDGSVTHTAVRLARVLGARSVSVVGADFGYPRAAAYARGCYLPVHAVQHGTRLNPGYSRLYRFVLDRPGVHRDPDDSGGRYCTPVLEQYRARLTDALTSVPEPFATGTYPSNKRVADIRAILREYADQLETMAPLTEPVWRCLAALGAEERNLWTTLFPLAASCHRSRVSGTRPGTALHPLEQARREAVALIHQLIE